MTTATTAKRCSACGEGVFVATDVRGKAFAYRDERALVLPESLTLPVCTACGEMRVSQADAERLDAALEQAYVAQRAATTRGFVESLVQSGWRQIDIEHAMGLSQGYISKVIRAEKTFGMAHLHHLYLLAKHPRATISQLAPAFPEIRELEESLVRRGALAKA
jgi:hypothetical protein